MTTINLPFLHDTTVTPPVGVVQNEGVPVYVGIPTISLPGQSILRAAIEIAGIEYIDSAFHQQNGQELSWTNAIFNNNKYAAWLFKPTGSVALSLNLGVLYTSATPLPGYFNITQMIMPVNGTVAQACTFRPTPSL